MGKKGYFELVVQKSVLIEIYELVTKKVIWQDCKCDIREIQLDTRKW